MINNFHIYPAIDIKNGQCVRLVHGSIKNETVYKNNPLTQVEHFIENGCKWVHIVDLDAALNIGNNEQLILNILNTFSKDIKIQLGGGIRSYQKIKKWLDDGISRVVIGTLAYENPDIINSLGKDCHDKISLAIDVKDNKVAIHGWKKELTLSPIDLVDKIDRHLLNSIIYTDIDRDGTMQGVNLKKILNFCKNISLPVIASGGVSNIQDVKNLYNLHKFGIVGIIIGKAIYEKTLCLKEINQMVNI